MLRAHKGVSDSDSVIAVSLDCVTNGGKVSVADWPPHGIGV